MFRSIAVTRSIAQVQRRAYSAQSSVAELRKEAKARGVSASGSKATILRRLQDSESSTQRRMSTNTTPTTTKPALTPGIPRTPEVQIETERKGHNYLFDVNIPEIQAEAQPTAKIPSLPDNYEITKAPDPAAELPPMPKLLVVGGTEARPDGGPLQALVDADVHASGDALASPAPPAPAEPVVNGKGGLWDDMAEDWGLSDLKSVRKSMFKLCPNADFDMIPPPLQRRLFHSTVQRLNRIGPPHPISNIRPIIYDDLPPPPPPQQQHPYSLEEFSTTQETVKDETVFRMQRTQLDQFNQYFWLDSNTRFEAGKEAVLSSLPSTSSALDKENALSEFYRHWLVQETERTESYTQEWRRRNKQNIILASRIAFRRLLQWPTSKK